MHYAGIKYSDIANGTGVRTCLFVSGCRRHCKACFNAKTWDFHFGEEFTEEVADTIIESLRPSWIEGLTVLGGEPMEPENQRELVDFFERVRREFPTKSIWCYTGDTFEEISERGFHHTEVTDRILACLDVLVDGMFIQELYDITLRFRGSSNQRLIDVPKTLTAGQVVLWEDEKIYSTHTMD